MYYNIKISSFFIISFISLSIIWLTSVVSISPVYLCLFCLFFIVLYLPKQKFYISLNTIVAYLLQLSFCVYISIIPLLNGTSIHNAYVLVFTSMFYIYADLLLKYVNRKKVIQKAILVLINVSLVYFLTDFIYRFISFRNTDAPDWIKANPIYIFYLFKENGIYDGDSNSIAVICLTLNTLLYLVKEINSITNTKNYVHPIKEKLLFLFLVLTFSRSCIMAFVFFRLFYRYIYKSNVYVKFFMIIVFVIFVAGLLGLFISDPSFQTKIEIYTKTFEWFSTANCVEKMFGVGANQSIQILGRYAHNPFSVYLIEYGVVGLFLYILMFMAVIFDSGRYGFLLVIPYFLCSLSFSPLHITYIFVSFAILKKYSQLNSLISKRV